MVLRSRSASLSIAEAITAPVFIDLDGNGYRAPFARR